MHKDMTLWLHNFDMSLLKYFHILNTWQTSLVIDGYEKWQIFGIQYEEKEIPKIEIKQSGTKKLDSDFLLLDYQRIIFLILRNLQYNDNKTLTY